MSLGYFAVCVTQIHAHPFNVQIVYFTLTSCMLGSVLVTYKKQTKTKTKPDPYKYIHFSNSFFFRVCIQSLLNDLEIMKVENKSARETSQ